jgi:hypothetical protein
MGQSRRRNRWDTVSKALRDAILESELSYLTLERETGVKRQSLMKFVSGSQSLRLDVADKLVVYFEFEIVMRR